TGRGEPEAAIAALEQAVRLSPFDPLGYLTTAWIALSHLIARRFEKAIEWADRALHEQPRLATAMRTRVVAYAELGRLDEARLELQRVLAIDPGLTIDRYRGLIATSFAPDVIDLYLAGLRKAGLPEA